MKKHIASFLFIIILALNLSGCLNNGVDSIGENSSTLPEGDVPVLSINIDGSKQVSDISKWGYLDATYSLTGGGMDIKGEKLGIKGRGNSSWKLPKKPFNLKLKEKTDLLGMGSSKKWALLANYWDKTLLRNYLTLNMAKDMGMQYTSDCRFVDLYINGYYRGNYLLTEKIEISENSVNIGKDGLLFELDERHSHNTENTYDTPKNVHITIKEPKEDKLSGEIQRSVENRIAEAEDSFNKGYDVYSKYIDVESFVDWYIVNEFVKNYDSKFVNSCYAYMNQGGKLHMGPVWDYDTCLGNQNTGDDTQNPVGWHVYQSAWYNDLTWDDTFWEMVKQRWTEIRQQGIIDNMHKNIEEASAYIEKSRNSNFEEWPDAMYYTELRGRDSKFTYQEEIKHLENWIKDRTNWMDRALGYNQQ